MELTASEPIGSSTGFAQRLMAWRIGPMPFAQISTRIGGAAMVVLATILLKFMG